LKRDLGDGFSVDAAGRLAAIRGISMSSVWYYYASPVHPENCTLWRNLGADRALVWRRHRGGDGWTFVTGDGGGERRIKVGR
jgi:hypothetical protein